jgi:Flp pilus assembly protein TadD
VEEPRGGARATSLDSLTRRIAPLLVAALTVALFAPALEYGFIFWDDDRNVLSNPHYRGLGWAQIRWAFTSVLMGHWIPVTWLTFSLDHAVWGMNPFGYHLTNVLLHAANTVLVYVVALALLRLALPAARPGAVTLGAVMAALFFAVHPLRVESVAWVTERRDVLSTCFYLLTVLAYLKACAAEGAPRRRWLAASIGAYALGLLSKSLIMSLPLALLVLDLYPLRRAAGRWRSVLIEKLPYLALAAVAAVISVSAVATLGLTSTAVYPPLARVGMALHSLTFYIWKTLLPVDLSPMYEVPARIDLTRPRFLVSALVAVGLTVGLLLARRRWPAALAVWLVYGLTLAPVSGIVHNGPQLVADRYSYLACLGLALLLGAAVASVAESPRVGNPVRMALVLASFAWLLVLAVLTREQLPIWRDAEEIWKRSLAVDPDCAFCHGQRGALLGNRGEIDLAIAHFERAVALRPNRPSNRGNLGLALLRAGRPVEAAVQLQLALTEAPTDAETRNRLGLALAQQGKLADASREFGRAVADNPRHAGALTNLGLSLIHLGRPAEAVPYLERAVALDPAALPRDALVRARGVTGARPRRRADTGRAIRRRRGARPSNPPRPPVVPAR